MTAFSGANWGNNPDNGKSMPSYIIFLANAPVIASRWGCRDDSAIHHGGRTRGRSASDEGSSVILKHDEGTGIRHASRQRTTNIDNTSALHVAGNRTCSSRVKHVALRYFFIQERVKKGRITVKYMKTEDQLADIGTTHLSEQRQRYLLKLICEFRT